MKNFTKMKLLFFSTKRFWIAIWCFITAIITFPTGIAQNGLDYMGSVLFLIISGILFILPEVSYSKKSNEDLWKRWEKCHDSQEQAKRIKRAFEADLNPYKVCTDSRCAIFVSQSTADKKKEKYRTTLKNCKCPDFKKRSIPCKHMYYLAKECGIDITNLNK